MKQITILSALFLFVFVTSQCGPEDSNHSKIPEVPKAKIEANAQSNIVNIKIEVPPNHHAYLDRGPDELFIPISFDWMHLIEEKLISVVPKIINSPVGQIEKSGVKVLRGTGTFVFKSSPSDSLKSKKVKVQTQLCSDLQGVCYRPHQAHITIQ